MLSGLGYAVFSCDKEHLPFWGILDWSRFSLSIQDDDSGTLINDLLEGKYESEIKRLQQNLVAVSLFFPLFIFLNFLLPCKFLFFNRTLCLTLCFLIGAAPLSVERPAQRFRCLPHAAILIVEKETVELKIMYL